MQRNEALSRELFANVWVEARPDRLLADRLARQLHPEEGQLAVHDDLDLKIEDIP